KREAPRPKLVQPKPAPRAEAKPVIAEVPKMVAVSLGNVDLKTPPTVEIATPRIAEPPMAAGSAVGKPSRSSDDDGSSKGSVGSGSAGKAYSENQVDRTVEVTRNVAPRYPESLRSVGVQGVVVLRFIVSADGKVEPGSIEVVSTTHKLFADAVRAALLNTRFRPAEAAGSKVRQLVEQNFTFKLNAADP
ncbi:MAG: TonB family protein, partial [Gemmatimonadaceae bacterium]